MEDPKRLDDRGRDHTATDERAQGVWPNAKVSCDIGPYRLLNLIITGQSSAVWEALHEGKQQRFAIKVLLDDTHRARFLEDADARRGCAASSTTLARWGSCRAC